jgi:hypothetical protein
MNQLLLENPEIAWYIARKLNASDFINFASLNRQYYAAALKYKDDNPDMFGTKFSEGTIVQYVNGQKHGREIFATYVCSTEKQYRNGLLHGTSIAIHYGPNQQVIYTSSTGWRMGKKHGQHIANNRNNLIVMEYFDDVAHGIAKTFQCENMEAKYLVSKKVFSNGKSCAYETYDRRGRVIEQIIH